MLVVKTLTANAGRPRRCRFDPWVGKIPWNRKWQHTPVFLPGEFHGHRVLAGGRLLARTESDMKEGTEQTRE